MKDVKLNELSPAWRELYDVAVAARKNAYIPYSNFAVGAAVRCAFNPLAKDATMLRASDTQSKSPVTNTCIEW